MSRRVVLSLLLLLASSVLVGSAFYPPVTRIEVSGGQHYSVEELLTLANMAPGDAFLWVNAWRLRRLVDDPWVSHVRVIRHWPDTISLSVWERRPVLTDGETTYAIDGTVLPNARSLEGLTRLDGWGPRKLDDIMELYRLLAEFEPQVIRYSPSGYEVQTASTRVFTPSVEALRTHWAGFLSQRGSFVAVYPWGVSVQP